MTVTTEDMNDAKHFLKKALTILEWNPDRIEKALTDVLVAATTEKDKDETT